MGVNLAAYQKMNTTEYFGRARFQENRTVKPLETNPFTNQLKQITEVILKFTNR